MAIHTIVFDAGDTIILTHPEFSGSMAHWPRLEAVPGVGEMLSALADRYPLVVASNAADSNAPLVRAGMVRLGLADFFSSFFTPAELNGARKPEQAFFLALEQQLGVSRSELVMVGDGYANDIVGAAQAGWRGVWFNPAGNSAPGLNPLHSAEITHMTDLPDALEDLDLPSVSTALAWLAGQGAGVNLIQHITMVAALAYQMAVWLRQAGEKVNPVLAHRGGLLHDLAKVPAREQRTDHGRMAALILAERGQPVLARIADRHLFFNIISQERRPETWEERLVYFADRLVERGKIVPFEQRLAAMVERHGRMMPEEEMDHIIDAILSLESDISRRLGWSGDQLLDQLRQAYRSE